MLLSLSLSACSVDLITPRAEISLPTPFLEKTGFRFGWDADFLWTTDNTAFFWQGYLVDPKTNSEDLSPLYMTNIQTKQTREIDTNGRKVLHLHTVSDGKTLYFTESLDTESPSIFGTCLYEYRLDTDRLKAHLCDVFSQHQSNINTSSRVKLAFSPDDTHMVYQINDSIFLYDLISEESRLLLDESSSASLAYPYYGIDYRLGEPIDGRLFSPDGTKLLVLVDSQLTVLTISTGELESLTLPLSAPPLIDESERFIGELRWTPEGILLLTQSDAASVSHTIYNLSSGSKQDIQLFHNSADPELFTDTPGYWSWSKASDTISYGTFKCFATNPGGLCINQWYLNVYNRQTSKQAVLAKNDRSFFNSLSNDGKKIIFSHLGFNSDSENMKTSLYLLDIP